MFIFFVTSMKNNRRMHILKNTCTPIIAKLSNLSTFAKCIKYLLVTKENIKKIKIYVTIIFIVCFSKENTKRNVLFRFTIMSYNCMEDSAHYRFSLNFQVSLSDRLLLTTLFFHEIHVVSSICFRSERKWNIISESLAEFYTCVLVCESM